MIFECNSMERCTPDCKYYGVPIPRNMGTPTCRLLLQLDDPTVNCVTKSSVMQIIDNRAAYAAKNKET